MRPAYQSGQTAFVTVGHPAFQMGEEVMVTSHSQVDRHAPVLYRVKDAWGRWHWMEGWQLAPQPVPGEAERRDAGRPASGAASQADLVPEGAWGVLPDQADRLFWCDACERAAPFGDWLLVDGQCPHCRTPASDGLDGPLRGRAAFSASDPVYRFQSPPAAEAARRP